MMPYVHRAIIRELAEYPTTNKWWIGLRNRFLHDDWWFLEWKTVCKKLCHKKTTANRFHRMWWFLSSIWFYGVAEFVSGRHSCFVCFALSVPYTCCGIFAASAGGYHAFDSAYDYPPYNVDPTKTCGSILYHDDVTLHGQWQPTACGTNLPFVCQKGEAYFIAIWINGVLALGLQTAYVACTILLF